MANRYSTNLSTRSYKQVNYKTEHLAIAEAALGRPIPAGVEVHHVDENKRNNARTNLVICQDRRYHVLLHIRRRVLKAGGDPNTQRICSECKELFPIEDFTPDKTRVDGRGNQCRFCCSRRAAEWYRRHRRVKSGRLCACGCGQETNLHVTTNKNGRGSRGTPADYINGHNHRVHKPE